MSKANAWPSPFLIFRETLSSLAFISSSLMLASRANLAKVVCVHDRCEVCLDDILRYANVSKETTFLRKRRVMCLELFRPLRIEWRFDKHGRSGRRAVRTGIRADWDIDTFRKEDVVVLNE